MWKRQGDNRKAKQTKKQRLVTADTTDEPWSQRYLQQGKGRARSERATHEHRITVLLKHGNPAEAAADVTLQVCRTSFRSVCSGNLLLPLGVDLCSTSTLRRPKVLSVEQMTQYGSPCSNSSLVWLFWFFFVVIFEIFGTFVCRIDDRGGYKGRLGSCPAWNVFT